MSDDELKNLAQTILEEEEDFLVPALKLYELIIEEKPDLSLEPEQLIFLLTGDDRFKIVDSQSTQEPWPEEDDEQMQKMGFYKGPRVMLKSKEPTKEEMVQAITEKMQRTLGALKSAYKVKPGNMTDDEEEEFLQIMKKAKDLQRKLDEAFRLPSKSKIKKNQNI